jgi:hypothetical protein
MPAKRQMKRMYGVGTPFAVLSFGRDATPLNVLPSFSDSEVFANTGLFAECLSLKMENSKLKAENESLRAKVVAMQATSYQPNEKQIDLAAVIGGIVNQIQEELPKLPLVSGAYCALNAQMNEISINVVMDSLDYDTEKELIKFFIIQEDKFPKIKLQTRFPVLSAEEADEIYLKEGSFGICYKRDK